MSNPPWRLVEVEVPITVSLSAYTAGDAVGGLLTSDNIKQMTGGCYINWLRLVDAADQAEPFTLYVFKSAPTVITDADTLALLEADQLLRVTTIDIAAADYDQTYSDVACAIVDGSDKTTGKYQIFPNLLNGRMYLYLVPSATPDYAAVTDLTLHMGLMVY